MGVHIADPASGKRVCGDEGNDRGLSGDHRLGKTAKRCKHWIPLSEVPERDLTDDGWMAEDRA